MKIRTGLMFLLACAFIWLPAASSSGAQGAVDLMEGPQFGPAPTADIVLVFDHQFKKKIPAKWEAKNGKWELAENKSGEIDFLSSTGVSDESATISYDERFTNFIFTVRMARKSSFNRNSNRIIVRASGFIQGDGHYWNEYSFNISRGGDYAVFKNVEGEMHEVVPWSHSDAIKRGGKWNELKVRAQGSSLFFYVNGQLLEPGEIVDRSLDGGKVGIGFYRHPDSTGDQLLVDWATLRKFVY